MFIIVMIIITNIITIAYHESLPLRIIIIISLLSIVVVIIQIELPW